MVSRKSKMNDGRESKADDSKPDLKWVVEWLVGREGQRRTAALLGVNRKTVALSLRRERLTGRMTLAVQRLMANLDDPGWERTTPLDRLGARMRLAIEAVDDLASSLSEDWLEVWVGHGDQAATAIGAGLSHSSPGRFANGTLVTISTKWPLRWTAPLTRALVDRSAPERNSFNRL